MIILYMSVNTNKAFSILDKTHPKNDVEIDFFLFYNNHENRTK